MYTNNSQRYDSLLIQKFIRPFPNTVFERHKPHLHTGGPRACSRTLLEGAVKINFADREAYIKHSPWHSLKCELHRYFRYGKQINSRRKKICSVVFAEQQIIPQNITKFVLK